MEAGGPGLVVALHGTYEWGGAAAVDGFPGGQTWREAIESVPAGERHRAVHEGHLVALNDRDRLAIAELAPLMTSFGVSGTAPAVREKVAALAASGVTEVAYQPSGPDIPRELRAFIDAVG
jgi:5,10-methylenetetrahydromethanopterin reductase